MVSTHERYMRRALELARLGEGRTSPNPAVGALIVQGDEVVGKGYHRLAGTPHAEVEAIENAGSDASGATLYVTLEPCNHHGRTPPCTEAIIEARIERVVYAVSDPNRRVAGGGAERLRGAGIDVIGGILEDDARYLNRFFLHHAETGQPWVVAKFGASLDGKTATSTGESKWVTGEHARARAHELRALVDAVLVGAGTVVADDPQLTVREVESWRLEVESWRLEVDGFQPLRIVLDSRGRTPASSKVYDPDLAGKTIVAGTSAFDVRQSADLERRGVEVLISPAGPRDRVDLPNLLGRLGDRGVQSILVEGGSEVLGSFLAEGLIDEVWAFIAPTLIGGKDAMPAIGGTGAARLKDRFEIANLEIERLDVDILIRGIRSDWYSSRGEEMRVRTHKARILTN